MWRFLGTTAGVCSLVVAPVWVGAGFLVPWLFGESFAASISVTRILLVGSLFGACRVTLADITRGLGLPHLSTILEVASWFWLFPSLAIMGSRWGINGVALALATSSAFSTLLFLVLAVRRLRDWDPVRPS